MNKAGKILATGGAIGLIAFLLYNTKQKNRNNAPVFYKKDFVKNYNARTIPPVGIFIKESEKENKALLEHEKVHWKQYQKRGLIKFYTDYYSQLKKYGYDKMPMETEARYNESEYCKKNYTECVRNDKANTVFNPNFRT